MSFPAWWRYLVIATATLVLCGCRGAMLPWGAPPVVAPNEALAAPSPQAAGASVRGQSPTLGMNLPQIRPVSHLGTAVAPEAVPYSSGPMPGQPMMQPMPQHGMPPAMMQQGMMQQGMMQQGMHPAMMQQQGMGYGVRPASHCGPGCGHPQMGASAGPPCPCCAGTTYGCVPSLLEAYHGDEVFSLGSDAERRPRDEYLCDGGDQEIKAKVGSDFVIHGLDVEDTVVHYDTMDGRRLVDESNKVCIYAPRFAAVRQVRGLLENEYQQPVARIDNPLQPVSQEDTLVAVGVDQPLQPVGQLGTKSPTIFRERLAGVGVDNGQGLIGLDSTQFLHEQFQVLQTGVFEQSEGARLAQAIDAAIVWTQDQGVQMLVKEQRLIIDTHDTKLGEIFMFEHEGTPKMRIVKVASTKDAQPGDIVEFVLRFDNVGDEPVGNVTIIDNLTTRLEYVEGSESSSLDAIFTPEPNEAESLGMRWEIIDPIPAGEGGVIRFKCRVR